jgi:hypothetical protein
MQVPPLIPKRNHFKKPQQARLIAEPAFLAARPVLRSHVAATRLFAALNFVVVPAIFLFDSRGGNQRRKLSMINSRKVTDRRQLRFASLDEGVRDAEALAEAERQGSLRVTGNWTLGQSIGHVAFWARAPFDGYPEMPQMPWLLRKLLPLFKNGFLNKRLPAGGRIPGVPEGTFGTEQLTTDDALAQLRAAFERLGRESPTVPNPIFGELTHEEWIKLNLRHAELHLGFFHSQ